MLIDFRVENHRSVRDEQVLTMEAGRIGDADDRRPRQVAGHSERLLPVVAIYGANASGKSNVLHAFSFMREAVNASHRAWEPDAPIPRQPFAFGPQKNAPSLFEVTILVHGVRYEYGFVAADDRFVEEWLFAFPVGKRQIWFERDDAGITFGDHLKGENKVIREVTRPNSLFLSAAAQLKHEQLLPIFRWFSSAVVLKRVASKRHVSNQLPPAEWTLEKLLDLTAAEEAKESQQATLWPMETSPAKSILTRFRTLVRDADVGILDLKVEKAKETYFEPERGRRIRLKHQAAIEDAWLPLSEESMGTQTLFRVGLPISQALQWGRPILIDELEASLHPKLGRQIVQLFNDPVSNCHEAQLIFTTHDTNLLGTDVGEPILRRDQVWFTEKDADGATRLYPLTDYKPRKSENIERGYLQGRFGAVPFLGSFFTPSE